MPNYTNDGLSKLILTNQQMFFWDSEVVTAPQLSVAFQLSRISASYYPWGFSVEVQFASAPGAFEFDIYGSDTDAKANFVKIGSITTVNGSNVGRFDTTSLFPKYVAGYLVSLTNTVNVTAKLTR